MRKDNTKRNEKRRKWGEDNVDDDTSIWMLMTMMMRVPQTRYHFPHSVKQSKICVKLKQKTVLGPRCFDEKVFLRDHKIISINTFECFRDYRIGLRLTNVDAGNTAEDTVDEANVLIF